LTADAIAERALPIAIGPSRAACWHSFHRRHPDPSLRAVRSAAGGEEKGRAVTSICNWSVPAGRRTARARRSQNLRRALDQGVEVVGGIPHSNPRWRKCRKRPPLCEEAANRGLRVDMHCDETDDPMSRHVETLAAEPCASDCRAALPARI